MARKFDAGAETVGGGGEDFKLPELGDHLCRLRSVIHLGVVVTEYKGVKKKPAPHVALVFELKEDDDYNDDGVPLEINKVIALRKGDKAALTHFLDAIDPDEKSKGMDDIIGWPCQIKLDPSKKTNDDGSHKYVNAGAISAAHKKLVKGLKELEVEGVGHIKFNDLTEDAIRELHPIREVNMYLEEGVGYAGSKAEEIIEEIRKDEPEFAKRKAKEETDSDSSDSKQSSQTDAVPPESLDENIEF